MKYAFIFLLGMLLSSWLDVGSADEGIISYAPFISDAAIQRGDT